MKHIFYPIVALIAVCAAMSGCRTSEANYRQAYERAMAGRDSAMAIDSTIYGRYRRDFTTQQVQLAGGRTADVIVQRVKLTDGMGVPPEYLRRYNVVVGRFKQIFNARSMRERLADSGFPRAMVLETAEPYYYVVINSFATADEAFAAMDSIAEGAIAMRPPLPYVLDATAARTPRR